jgi:hypothetical protein
VNELKVRELPETEAAEALKRTGLDIMVAGDPLKGETKFFAAHNRSRSYAVLADRGEITVWEVSGGWEENRRAAVQRVREKYGEQTS